MTENLINRISFYLASGGLFNPELADHVAVRTLLFECREALAQRTWVGMTEAEHTEMAIEWGCMSADWVFYAAAVERKLRDKNT